MKILIQSWKSEELTQIDLNDNKDPKKTVLTTQNIFKQVKKAYGINTDEFRLTVDGEELPKSSKDLSEMIKPLSVVKIELMVDGGKGGFGSLLRIAAAQKKHFNNFDSSRDMNGRRLRDIKNEQRLKEWYRKKRREEEYLRRENAQVEKKEKNMEIEQTYIKIDQEYNQKIKAIQGDMRSIVRSGALKMKNKQKQKLALKPLRAGLEDIDEQAYGSGGSLEPSGVEDMAEGGSELGKRSRPQSDLRQRLGLPEFTAPPVKKKKMSLRERLGLPPKSEDPGDSPKAKTDQKSSQKSTEKILAKINEKTNKNNNLETTAKQALKYKYINGSKKEFKNSRQNPKTASNQLPGVQITPLNLKTFSKIADLEALGAEKLKQHLKLLGLKSGGSLKQRAERLWKVKTDPASIFDPKLQSSKN